MTSLWRPNTALFTHPALGELLPDLILRPERVAIDRSAAAGIIERARDLSSRFSWNVAGYWSDRCRRPLEESVKTAIHGKVTARLEALGRADQTAVLASEGFERSLMTYQHWGHLSALQEPLEAALHCLHGNLLLYARWGEAGLYTREMSPDLDDFLHTAERADLRRDSYRWPIDDDYEVVAYPGDSEAIYGIDYHLRWWGETVDGRRYHGPIATVGFVRRPEGYAIVHLQGGEDLLGHQVEGGRNLLEATARRFGVGPRRYIAQRVLNDLSAEEPSGRLSWLRAERMFWLPAHPEAAPAKERLNRLATKLGFRWLDPQSPWMVRQT